MSELETSPESLNSSGSVYGQPKDISDSSESSDAESIRTTRFKRLYKTHNRRASKQSKSAPQATSTPTTAGAVYSFSDEGDAEILGVSLRTGATKPNNTGATDQTPKTVRDNTGAIDQTPKTVRDRSAKDPVSLIIDRMEKMEGKLLRVIAELRQDVKDRDEQIILLTRRLGVLEERIPVQTAAPTVEVPKRKSTNLVKATIRQAFEHAEEEKGLKLTVEDRLKSRQNQEVVDFAWKFARGALPDIHKEEFYAATTRYHTSLKERDSRHKSGRHQQYKDTVRKHIRKNAKSRNRVAGIRQSGLPQHRMEKLERVLAQPQMMSTEASAVDEDVVCQPDCRAQLKLKPAKV